MNKKNKYKAVVSIAVALAFVLPGAAAFADNEKLGKASDHDVDVNSIDIPVSGLDGTAFSSNSWTEVVYSGTGHWEPRDYSHWYAYFPPPGTGTSYAEANAGIHGYDVYDVGLFTPSLDLTGLTGPSSATLEFEMGIHLIYSEWAEVNTYSGGSLEENLATYGYGFYPTHEMLTFDPSGYTYPNDVTIEFYFSTGVYPSYCYCMGFAIDDVTIDEIGFFEGFEGDTFPPGPGGDTTPPEITALTLTTSDPLDTIIGWENFSCTVTDDVLVDVVQLNITYPDLHTEYILMTNIPTTDTYYHNTTLTDHGNYTYHIWADDTSDNQAESTPDIFSLPPNWDVNMDGKGEFWDLIAISFKWTNTGANGWVREDVDNLGMVEFWDLIAVSFHWGETWW